jgi:peptidoglycan/LPS O-acetylase OafA/YrhL
LIGFPLLLAIATRSEPTGRAAAVFRYLGVLSYALYTLHAPLGTLAVKWLGKVGHIPFEAYRGIALFGFLAILIPFAWVADECYDAPVRRRLTKRWQLSLKVGAA